MDIFAQMPLWILAALCLAFFIAGFVDSIAGGGGFISMPSLLLAGIPPIQALATNKFIVIFGTSVAAFNFFLHKKLLYKLTIIGVIFSLFGAFIGSRVVLLVPDSTLKNIILIILPIAALASFIPKSFNIGKTTFSPREIYIYTPILSCLIGFYDGFFGPGTGTFFILAFYLGLKMDLLYASASAKMVNLASGLGSFVAFAISGNVLYKLGIPLIVCNILGGYIGSKLAIKKGVKFIRVMVVGVFVLMFISLVLEYLDKNV